MSRVVVLYSGGRHWGGIETYLANLFRLYDRSRLDLTLASLGEWDLTRELRGAEPPVRVRVLSGRRFRPRSICDLRRVLREEQAELLVSQGVVANAYARAAVWGTKVPSLVVVHSDQAGDYPATLRRWAFMLSDRWLRPTTKQYIAVSAYLKRRLIESGIRAERVNVIYNGAAITERHSPPAGRRRSRQVAGKDEVSLVSVGRLHAVKNFQGLIAAMPLLPDQVRLVIWGEGTEKAVLAGLIGRLGLRKRVELRGESASMGQAFEEADIYVQPSTSEGFGLTVVEAMLHGKPVVVTPRGSLVELVEDGRTGVVAEDTSSEALAAAIKKLVCDHELAAKLAAAGRREAEQRFALDEWLDKTTTVFCESARGEAPTG